MWPAALVAIAIPTLLASAWGQGLNLPAEVAAAPCGILHIAAGTYTIESPIVKRRCVTLVGDGMATKIVFDGTGPAVILGDTGPEAYALGGLQYLTLVGPGEATNTVGVWLGGDPAGSGLGPGGFGDAQILESVRVVDFGVGVEWGSNAWGDVLERCLIFDSGVGITVAPNATNLTEENRFVDGGIFNNYGPGVLNASAADLVFIAPSLDYNGGPEISNTDLLCIACHLESSTAPLVDNSQQGSIRIFGGTVLLNVSGGDAPALFVAGPNTAQVLIEGAQVWSNEPVDALLAGQPSGPVMLSGVTGNGNHAVRRLAAADIGNVLGGGNLGFSGSDGGAMSAGTIRAGSVDAGAIRATSVSAGTISAASATAGTLSASSISAGAIGATSLALGGSLTLSGGQQGLAVSNSGVPLWSVGADGVIQSSGGLMLAGSDQALRTTEQTGSGELVMSQTPTITGATLASPSIGGGPAVPRMVFAGQQVSLPAIRSGLCYDANLKAPGAVLGDVAFASPMRTYPVAKADEWRMTWSAAVETNGAVTVEACNPTKSLDPPTNYFWSAWVIGGYPPPPHKANGPRRVRHEARPASGIGRQLVRRRRKSTGNEHAKHVSQTGMGRAAGVAVPRPTLK
ncbi:MAG: hypothetical protein ACRD04_07870 [Terriglobales bacterium]